ncbi:ABC transporter ATP-binding protein [Gordonia sp. ABKF26]|uniref:ABC transporter ATP-binding protein n=1 Tax=Gordonia sp. ABKF26 TaxID=3238687 RepID=UPI0034E3FC9C
MTDAIRVEGISVGYGDATVLDGLSLHVPTGSITAVIGPSGCGKTTLLRAIAGLEPIRAGRVEIDGVEVASSGPDRERHVNVPPERRRFGLVPQEGALFDNLSVAGNVGFGLGPWWRPTAGRAERIAELLEAVGLGEFGARRPGSLSGGQRQRVALARALAPRPAVIALDEPFSALDAQLRTHLREHVRDTMLAEGASGLLVTHDREEAMAMADRIVVVMQGRVRQVGLPEEIYLEPVDSEVAKMFGAVTELTASADGETVSCVAGRLRIRRPAHGPGVVMLRPEDLEIVTGIPGDGSAEVVSVRPRGSHTDIRVSVPAHRGDRQTEMSVRAEPGWAGSPGSVIDYRQRRPVHFHRSG